MQCIGMVAVFDQVTSKARQLVHKLVDPVFMRRFHAFATVAWLILSIPSMTLWRNSITYLIFVSVYANFVGHWSGAQAAQSAELSSPNK
jgi:hypothetical protein